MSSAGGGADGVVNFLIDLILQPGSSLKLVSGSGWLVLLLLLLGCRQQWCKTAGPSVFNDLLSLLAGTCDQYFNIGFAGPASMSNLFQNRFNTHHRHGIPCCGPFAKRKLVTF
jgi:hypothetical protein